MGCASSAPFMGEGGALGEIKEAANEMVESGEHALHEMGEAAGKTIHNAVEDVKEVVSSAAHGIQDAAESIGLSAGKKEEKVEAAVADAAEEASRFIPLKSMSEEKSEETSKETTPAPSITEDPPPTTTEMFKPTPAPSFDKPPTPSATVLSMSDMLDKPMDKIDEALASASLEELANDLMNEQELTEEKPDDTDTNTHTLTVQTQAETRTPVTNVRPTAYQVGGARRRDGGAASEDVHRPGHRPAVRGGGGGAPFEAEVLRQAGGPQGDLERSLITQLEKADPLQESLTPEGRL